MKKKKVIVYIYNSFNDPLFKGNLLMFLKDLGLLNRYHFFLITYEQKEYALTAAAQSAQKKELEKYSITWYPLTWHSGRFKLLKKMFDVAAGAALVFRLRLKGGRAIVSLATISGSFAFVLSRLFGLKLYCYQYEPHSEFMLDTGEWKRTDLVFKVLHWLEKQSAAKANALSSGTDYMLARIAQAGTRARLYKLPSCVDERKFSFSSAGREKIRQELGLEGRQVVLYLGKFGGLYFSGEVVQLFNSLYAHDPAFFFLIVTPDTKEEVTRLFENNKAVFPYLVTRSPYETVQDYISAADMGVVAVPPLPAQKFRSPIKVGEYLCTGLPYIVCEGVSEDDRWAASHRVGVVLKDFTGPEVERQYPAIRQLLDEPKEVQRERCRQAGIAYRGYSRFFPIAQQIFESL